VNITQNEFTRKPNCSDGAGFNDILCNVPLYCFVVDNFTSNVCLETGILELWGYDDPSVYENLTQESILERVNNNSTGR
jgi:hypothetical protein